MNPELYICKGRTAHLGGKYSLIHPLRSYLILRGMGYFKVPKSWPMFIITELELGLLLDSCMDFANGCSRLNYNIFIKRKGINGYAPIITSCNYLFYSYSERRM